MGLYENWVLPRLTDLVLNTPKHEELRGCTTECLSGEVLELGFGSGLNVPHYPSEVTKIWAVEPSAVSFKRAEERIQQSDIPVEMAAPSGERIPLTTDSIDSALSTWTLCTIPDLTQALAEVRRVLKPGHKFCFLEHGLSDEAGLANWQHRLNWLERRMGGGCNLNRRIDQHLVDAGFELHSLKRFQLRKGLSVMNSVYMGVATNPAS